MYSLNKIIVCLDLSEVDDQLMKASASMARLSGRKFYFLHVVKSLDLPKEVKKKYADLIAPVDENVKAIIEDKLKRYFKNAGDCEYEIDVVKGNVTDVILKWSKAKKADLIIMGKKLVAHGSGVHPEKVVKLCHCSFLLIPHNSYHGLKRMIVPVDFSESSKMALEQAMVISKSSGAEIICQHSYHVPSGYHSTGKSYEEFAEIMKTNSIKDYRRFLKGMGLERDQFPCIYTLVEGHTSARAIHDIAVNEEMDLIIMGSKGRTGLASMFLGSVAMKTVMYDLEVELLIVKNKNENMGILQALRNI